MTVAEFISKLQEMPQEAKLFQVDLDGFSDCYGQLFPYINTIRLEKDPLFPRQDIVVI